MNEKPLDRLEARWREEASKPPTTSPEDAARQILARIERQTPSRRMPMVWLTAAAALVLVVGLAWWLRLVRHEPLASTTIAQVTAPAVDARSLDANVVLFWLDPDTPLYMTMRPARGEQP